MDILVTVTVTPQTDPSFRKKEDGTQNRAEFVNLNLDRDTTQFTSRKVSAPIRYGAPITVPTVLAK